MRLREGAREGAGHDPLEPADGISDGLAVGHRQTTADGFALTLPHAEFTTGWRGGQWTPWTSPWLPSKPLVGILGDVDGRIVPVAPPPFRIRPVVLETAVVTQGSQLAERTGVPTA